jgi:hypothetical protein
MVRKLAHFKKEKGYAVFCPAGQVSFDEMAELVSWAVVLCRPTSGTGFFLSKNCQ